MITALNDARGGHKGYTCVFLEIGDIGYTAVAHGLSDLIEALGNIVMKRSGVNDI